MAGPYLWLKREFEPAVTGASGAIVDPPPSLLVSKNLPVAGRDTLPYWQGLRVQTGQGMGCV